MTGPGRIARKFYDGWDIYGFPKDHEHGDEKDFAGGSYAGKYDVLPPGPPPPPQFTPAINRMSDAPIFTTPDSGWYYFNAVAETDWTFVFNLLFPHPSLSCRVYLEATPPTDLSGPYTRCIDHVPSLNVHAKTFFLHLKPIIFATEAINMVVTCDAELDDSIGWSMPFTRCVGIPNLRGALVLGTSRRTLPADEFPTFFIRLRLAAVITAPLTLQAGLQLAAVITVQPVPILEAGLQLAALGEVPAFVPPTFDAGLQLADVVNVSMLLVDLVAYWKLDEESGNAVDAHGSNDLTDTNTVGSAAGKINEARDFVAGNSEFFVMSSDDPDFKVTGTDYTWTAWVKLESSPGDGFSFMIVSKFPHEYEIRVTHSTNTLEFLSGLQDVTCGTNLSIGTWHFIASWRSIADGKLYIQLDNGTVDEVAYSTDQLEVGFPVAIGARPNSSSHMNGAIDEVGFWKRVLSSDERTAVYNGNAGKPYEEF